MKIQKRVLDYICMLFFMIMVISCRDLIRGTELLPTTTPSKIVEITSSTTTPTQARIPTLPVDDADTRLINLLASNSNCNLPCVWGITPGENTHEDAQEILVPLSSISDFTSLNSSPGDISPIHVDGNKLLVTRIAFSFSEDRVINHITFQIKALNKIMTLNGEPSFSGIFEVTPFTKYIEYYMLPSILSKLGVPASVVISTSAKPNPQGQGGFEIVVLYPELGVAAHYTTNGQLIGNDVTGCFSSAFVDLDLYPAGDSVSFSKGFTELSWARFWPGPIDTVHWKQLEKATNMTLEEFFETFREPTGKCIKTPANLWPTPEQ